MPHINELIDFTVSAFIGHNNKVLLVFHKKLKRWLPVGGHIELDEDPEQALFREISEECGLQVEILASKPEFKDKGRKALLTPNYLDIHDISETHKHVGLTYFAKAKSNEAKLAPEEHDDIKWFSEADLDNPEFAITDDIKFYALEALRPFDRTQDRQAQGKPLKKVQDE
jgi:ADP-ribose pyrophosphatase YjhB (NUDIX family)